MKRMFAAVPLSLFGMLLGCQSAAPARKPEPSSLLQPTPRAAAAPERPDFSDQERYLVPVEFLEPKAPAAAPEPLAAPLPDGGQTAALGTPPRPGLVWVPGHQVWRHGSWVQVPGLWLKPEPGTSAYVPGYRKQVAPGRYEWIPGYWR